jgi:P27 family predicted phage terminase small subunit
MGRPAKSNELHRLHGTKPQSRAATESVFVGGRPKFPGHLSKVARAEAKRVVKLLEDRRTVTPGDIALISLYAEVYSRWVATKAAIGDELMVEIKIKDSNGAIHSTQRLNPLLKVAQADEAKLIQLTTQMGLTPAARDRVRPTKAQRNNLEVIAGSVADLMPGLLEPRGIADNHPEVVAPPDRIEEDQLGTGEEDADTSETL